MQMLCKIIMASMMLSSCVERAQDVPANDAEYSSEVDQFDESISNAPQKQILSFDIVCKGQVGVIPHSKLNVGLKRLKNQEHNYQIVERLSGHDRGALEQSIFYELVRQNGQHNSGYDIHINGLEYLISQITETEYVKIRGKKSVEGRYIYPRASVDTYVFNSEDCADAAVRYLSWANTKGVWGGLHKAPSVIFRNEHSVYYVLGGGEYMRGRLPEIQTALQEN